MHALAPDNRSCAAAHEHAESSVYVTSAEQMKHDAGHESSGHKKQELPLQHVISAELCGSG